MLTILLSLPVTLLIGQNSDQQITSAQGDFSRGTSMTITWTIGDLVTESAVNEQGILTQGFQQPALQVRAIESDVPVNPIETRDAVQFDAHVFPNPVGAHLNVEVQNATEEYELSLFDSSGKLIMSNKSRNSLEVLQFNDLPSAQYTLKIQLLNSGHQKVFQIMKIR